ncbi:hypothetical protein JB92DRAFT_3019492 [Gautieria morchelliformis]|nr:hypothetical protein JB92DRAFT_3019492 [Gautieria morchelliformis]
MRSRLTTNFYAGGTKSPAQAVIDRIDSISNMVYASNYINSAKLAVIGHHSNVGRTGLMKGFPSGNIAGKAAKEARRKTEMLIRAFGAFPEYMDLNAAAYQSTAQDIITTLQGFDRTTKSVANPPVAVQFYEFLATHVSQYSDDAKSSGKKVAESYNKKVIATNPKCTSINAAKMIGDIQQSPSILKWPNLLPNRPLCFPDTSPGLLGFDQSKTSFPGTIIDGVVNGVNMKVNLRPAADEFLVFTPLSAMGNTSPTCAGVGEISPGTIAPSPPLFELSCSTRRLKVVIGGTTLGSCQLIAHTDVPQDLSHDLVCGPSSTAVQQCMASWNLKVAPVDLKWVPT